MPMAVNFHVSILGCKTSSCQISMGTYLMAFAVNLIETQAGKPRAGAEGEGNSSSPPFEKVSTCGFLPSRPVFQGHPGPNKVLSLVGILWHDPGTLLND